MSRVSLPELLAPAGDQERLEAALLFGADAVYLGGKSFGMRAGPQNFDQTQLAAAVERCHRQGVKVYLTCNTLPRGEEAEHLPEFIRNASRAGVDALIVADIGVLMMARREAPELAVHISTQMGVVNHFTATELYHLGASRVVLARELSLDEIAFLRDRTPPELELEAFVHGAMCVSFSGRCMLSQYLVGRDANRGECAQPCRWGYHLVEEKRLNQPFPIYEDEKGTYILNAQDMCMLEHLDKLQRAGITSFKIEGRAKSAYYVAVVTGAYRQAMDLLAKDPDNYNPPAWLVEETRKVSHRQYCTGFFFPDQPPNQYLKSGGYVRDWEVVAVVEGWQDGELLCREKNRFSQGETVEVMQPMKPPVRLEITAITDEEGQVIETARHPHMLVKIPSAQPFAPGSLLRIRREEE
ncbi:U32 family peptidase [Oscillospiraceae bacterium MB08-C2-2]|nr:U32 family peptidase [Oscillospiraceae bacterium MB08-C2-2]